MNSNENWHVLVVRDARKQLKHFPQKDTLRIQLVLRQMERDFYDGDVAKLEGRENI